VKLWLRTFGCRANHYDTATARTLALQGGYEIVDDVRDADVALVNSCAVTSEADRDARKAVRRIAAANPRARTIVMGCSAALPDSAATLTKLPGVDRVVPGADTALLAEALGVASDLVATLPQDTVRAVLRVQDGCDEHCTFCATTHARGANRSRPVEDLLREARVLAGHHPEIVITGTHIGSYGVDTGSSLGELVESLVREIPAVRFRLSSLEATEVDERLVDLFLDGSGRLAPHLHAPLQSGSDRLLKRMGRHWYTAGTYAAAIERIASRLPVFALGADLIAAFPGETEEDHAATVALIEALPFTYLHVFTYSPRPGTAATKLSGHVPLSAVQARSHELRHLGQKKGKEYRAARAGGKADVVVISGGPDREGMTEDYLTVRVPASRIRGERFRGVLALEGEALACHSERSEESAVRPTADPSALRASG
jgi:threonylcarbamoyladenosine tRNA methylthiotransferase MtaB